MKNLKTWHWVVIGIVAYMLFRWYKKNYMVSTYEKGTLINNDPIYTKEETIKTFAI